MTRHLRILHLLRAPIGGLYRHVADLSRELVARGHAIGIVTDSHLADAQTDARLRGLDLALGLHKISIPRTLGPADLTAPFKVKRLAKALGVDILHGHGAKGGFHARLAGLGTRRPAIYTPHGGVLHFDPGSVAGRTFLVIERMLLRHTDALIFESAYAARTYADRIGPPPCPAPVIHNGLAESEFAPLPDCATHDFAYVGELRDLKGVGHLVDAMALLKTPDGHKPTLVMAGDGPMRATLVSRLAERGLNAQIALVGVKPAREVFALARCIVVPSLAESLPYVVMEAAAAQKPVISTNVGGIPEIFGPTAKALVAAGDTPALAAAMQAFLDDATIAQSEMRQRLDHVRAAFSATRMADGVEEVYRAALTDR